VIRLMSFTPRTAARMQAVQTPVIPVVGDLVRSTPGAISLGQGVVHYGPPSAAIVAAQQFGADPHDHKYQSVAGIAELVELIADKLARENSADLTGRSIVVTAGGNMAFFNALLAIVDSGDEIILPTPYYFNHEMAITMLGCRPVLVPTTEDYQLNVDALAAAVTPRTRAIVTVSPNNPSGAVYSRPALTAVNRLCHDRGIYHISDEAYEYFTFDGAEHFSPGSLPDSQEFTISLFSLSKAYGFASWRIGYAVIPEHLLVATKKEQDTILICPPVISQVAACAALRTGSPYCRERIAGFAQVRRTVRQELAAIESFCHVPATAGALYYLLKVDTKLDDMTIVTRLVKEFGVAVMPGSTFGIDTPCTLRLSFGGLDAESVAAGVSRLVRGLRAIVGNEIRK
jgi:aspartate/methionine/tyrosine aminotransferase